MKRLEFNTILSLVTTGCLFFTLASCTNSLSKKYSDAIIGSNGTTTGTTGGTGSSSQDKIVISTVNIAAPSSGSSTNLTTSIFFDTAKSSVPISTHCSIPASGSSQTSKPCVCQFSWTEVNPNAGSSSNIPRLVTSAVGVVQPNFVSCNAPEVYSTEILDGTQIKIKVVAGANNPDSGLFDVPAYTYTKSTTVTSGSFQDSQGHMFDNVMHYSCYQKFKRGMTIQSASDTKSNSQTGEVVSYLFGSKFCTAAANSSGSSSSKCQNVPSPDFSSQAYYYNLYIRSTESGDYNQFNDGFICPLVQEGLTSGSSTGTKFKPWPLDTQFALSLSPTGTFSVGVVANTKLANGSSNVSNSSCFSASNGGGNSGGTGDTATTGFITSCLGFAAKTNSDGTCPSFKDAGGQIRSTYRLRRYIAIYPRVFDTNGSAIQGQSQDIDTIYVLDRPVKGPSNSDPQKPYTMLGPKPCPFAFFDKKSVAYTNNPPRYVSTSDPSWSGKNVDGIEFPNFDGKASCSASLPLISPDKNAFSIITINKNNPNSGTKNLYIRPTQPFFPHYEEDTDFLACAPQASPFQDPPLHFSRDPDTGRVAWCAESYPTQNSSVQKLDPPVMPTATPTAPSGNVVPFTSHVVKNTTSRLCNSTKLTPPTNNSYNYDQAAGGKYAYHPYNVAWDSAAMDVTCDRTVTQDGLAWPQFPLLAHADAIEAAIRTNSSYMCLVTYDNHGSKTNTLTPSDGCCDRNVVQVISGSSGPGVAHLEPDTACRVPQY